MSEETWIAEFYPVPAENVSAEDALDHSIKKWEGALRKNLKKHGLESAPIVFDGDSCALCVNYLYIPKKTACKCCPLFIVRGNVNCCNERPGEWMSPFDQYGLEENPRPMLTWLKKAKEMK